MHHLSYVPNANTAHHSQIIIIQHTKEREMLLQKQINENKLRNKKYILRKHPNTI